MLLITSADEYLGHCITSHLSQFHSLRLQIRALIYKTDATAIPSSVLNFSKKGIDVCAVDYMHANDLSKAFRNVEQMILIVNGHKDRVQHCQHLCQAAIRCGVRSIVLLSHIGASSEQHIALHDYGCVETYLVQQQQINRQYSFQWTIIRLDWVQQYFHLWAYQVESKRTLELPLAYDTGICPVDISDICHVVTSLLTQKQDQNVTLVDLDDKHSMQLYTLTGIEPVTSKDLIQILIDATQYNKMAYRLIRPMDTSFYLRNLSHNIWFDERIKREKSKIFYDNLDDTCAYRQNILNIPSDVQIQTFLDYFDWVNKTYGSFPIDDIRHLMTGKEPKSIKQYFAENSNSFKPRV
ncbi:hypothetical protein EDC96DRAFT_450319 [Choanephora cucurbitarum]|nr:hypothetical protein EDC96DRAFT_450319 [Choanephora cucurbitarum]